MTRQEWWFLLLLIVNFIIAAVYLILGWLFRSKQEGKLHFLLKALVMLLCPLVGPLYFFIGYLNFRFLMHRPVDLADVIFSKDRTRSLVRADEDRERNMVPLEEAIAVTDKDNLRTYMLNVLRGNIQDSLAAIAMALNSEDSETSHYAASVLRDELNDFRVNVQKLYEEIKRDREENEEDLLLQDQLSGQEGPSETHKESRTSEQPETQQDQTDNPDDDQKPEYDEEQLKYCGLLLDYMNPVLSQRVFTTMEQSSFAEMMDEVAEILYTYGKERMRPEYYEWVCLRLTEMQLFERARIWGKRGLEECPAVLSSYTCLLKLYFTMGEKENFFHVLEALKQSRIVVDSETLELIRVFG